MEDVKRLPNYNLFRKPRTRAIRELNNIFVVAGIARNAVNDARGTLRSGPRTKLRFTVPTIRDEQIVAARNRSKILSLLEQAVNQGLFAQALAPAVAVSEGYLADMLAMILQAFPHKLGSTERKIDLQLVLQASDLDQLLGRIISTQIHTTFYASPADYFQYIEDILSISIPKSRKAAYAEVKATRDIYVHNSGITNEYYIKKSGDLARAVDGEPLPLDEDYFSSAITCMKGIIQSVYTGLLKKYGKSQQLSAKKKLRIM